MILKEFYVIVNKNGEFFCTDSSSGGYPCFLNTYACVFPSVTAVCAALFLWGKL